MSDVNTAAGGLKPYFIWDRPVRYCHWISVLCVICLMAIDGKILLKTWHVYVGYIFALNLIFRIIWGVIGSASARWHTILPIGPSFRAQFSQFIVGLK